MGARMSLPAIRTYDSLLFRVRVWGADDLISCPSAVLLVRRGKRLWPEAGGLAQRSEMSAMRR
jgi:hypothetical protein